MNKITGEFLQELFSTGIFNYHSFLTLNEGVNVGDLQRYKLDANIPSTALYIDAKSSYNDTKVGSVFDVAFALHSPEEYENIKAQIESSSIRPGVNLGILPKGYSGICLIDFQSGLPKCLKKLKPSNELNDSEKFDSIYLTTRIVILEILNRMK